MKKKTDEATRGLGDAAIELIRRSSSLVAFALMLSFLLIANSCAPSRGGVTTANAAYGKCPVCGMNVKESDDWTAEIFYRDQTKLLFESPGDMLAFYTTPKAYQTDEAHQDRANIDKIVVKDYQTKQPADARQAKFVYNSRVEGPMGPEFIPFAKREDAEAFVSANGGTVTSLDQITSEIVREVRK